MLQSTNRNPQPLRYYLHDDPDAFRMELEGSLTQPGAESAYYAWHTALSTLSGRPVIVDITFVTRIDDAGREVLLRWQEHGARIVARSPQSRALAAGIALEPAPLPAPKRNWRQRAIFLAAGMFAAGKQTRRARHDQAEESAVSTRLRGNRGSISRISAVEPEFSQTR
jgi:ABC-type transporter Mla MlaB component